MPSSVLPFFSGLSCPVVCHLIEFKLLFELCMRHNSLNQGTTSSPSGKLQVKIHLYKMSDWDMVLLVSNNWSSLRCVEINALAKDDDVHVQRFQIGRAEIILLETAETHGVIVSEELNLLPSFLHLNIFSRERMDIEHLGQHRQFSYRTCHVHTHLTEHLHLDICRALHIRPPSISIDVRHLWPIYCP